MLAIGGDSAAAEAPGHEQVALVEEAVERMIIADEGGQVGQVGLKLIGGQGGSRHGEEVQAASPSTAFGKKRIRGMCDVRTSKTHQLRRPEIQEFCVTRTLSIKLPFISAYLSLPKPSSSCVMLSHPF